MNNDTKEKKQRRTGTKSVIRVQTLKHLLLSSKLATTTRSISLAYITTETGLSHSGEKGHHGDRKITEISNGCHRQ